jgi:hypothetical protein
MNLLHASASLVVSSCFHIIVGNAALCLFASNLFQKYTSHSSETWAETFRSWSNNSYPSRRYGISISWRFGELKTQVKKTQRSITNDDVKAGGDNQAGGSMQ